MQKNIWGIKEKTTPVRLPDSYIEGVKKYIFREKKRREKTLKQAKLLVKPDVSKCEDVERGDAVCVAPDDEGCFCKEIDMGCLECKYFRYKQTDC